MTRALFMLAVGVVASAQNLPDVLKQGEKVFSGTCATGYCHGVRGTAAGAPRLVGRGFDQAFINDTVTQGVARCSTCHQINGIGISVATPMTQIPVSVPALRALATPRVSTANAGGETMPALVLSKTSRNVILYDLTTPPPVQRTLEPASVNFAEGSPWRHASVIGSYNDAELGSILIYLRDVEKR